jgi:hypothetical protein
VQERLAHLPPSERKAAMDAAVRRAGAVMFGLMADD